jgi:hypothetical protein
VIDPANPAGWSERQLRVLAALLATISEPAYEGESERHSRLAATALNEVAEPGDLRQLRLVLDLLEAPVGLPRLTGTRPFSRLSREAREGLLHAWAASRLAQRRTFFHTIKRLASFFAYADPGADGANPRWPEIGYEAPEHELPEPGPIAASLIRPGDGQSDFDLEADVVVVGSGAAGGVVAARLAEQGHDVVVVEAGPYAPEADMPRNELEAFNRLYLDHGMTATGDLGLVILAGSALGGGTLINWATCLEPPPSLRREAFVHRRASGRRTRRSSTARGRWAGRQHRPSATPTAARTAAPVVSAASPAPSGAASACTSLPRHGTGRASFPVRRSRESTSKADGPWVFLVNLEAGAASRSMRGALSWPPARCARRRCWASAVSNIRSWAGTCTFTRLLLSLAGSTRKSSCGAARCRGLVHSS